MRKPTNRNLVSLHDLQPVELLERRLNDGYQRIDNAMKSGQDVTGWEDFWIELLHQYEAAFDALPEAPR